jgi:DNA-binding MarR family transcriptional regulator
MVNHELQVGYILKQAQSLLHARMEEALKPLALSVTQYSCLHHLRREPGISASALARATFVTRQSMNATLQQLLDREFVSRPAQAESGRALPTVLTPLGEEVLHSASVLIDEVEQRMIAGLTESDRAALVRSLVACVSGLDS